MKFTKLMVSRQARAALTGANEIVSNFLQMKTNFGGMSFRRTDYLLRYCEGLQIELKILLGELLD